MGKVPKYQVVQILYPTYSFVFSGILVGENQSSELWVQKKTVSSFSYPTYANIIDEHIYISTLPEHESSQVRSWKIKHFPWDISELLIAIILPEYFKFILHRQED